MFIKEFPEIIAGTAQKSREKILKNYRKDYCHGY